VFEDLTDTRERLPHAKWHHVRAFRRLFECLSYRTPERGVSVEQVEPDHTSRRCSRTDCGFTHEGNRHGEHFECRECGYGVNPDYNGARNVGLRYARKQTHRLRSSPTSGGGDAQVDVRTTGGALNGKSHQPITGDRLLGAHIEAPSPEAFDFWLAVRFFESDDTLDNWGAYAPRE
jgi:transposase